MVCDCLPVTYFVSKVSRAGPGGSSSFSSSHKSRSSPCAFCSFSLRFASLLSQHSWNSNGGAPTLTTTTASRSDLLPLSTHRNWCLPGAAHCSFLYSSFPLQATACLACLLRTSTAIQKESAGVTTAGGKSNQPPPLPARLGCDTVWVRWHSHSYAHHPLHAAPNRQPKHLRPQKPQIRSHMSLSASRHGARS